MDSLELARLLVMADRLSPERYPERAIALNQRIVELDPHNAAAYVRLARGYQAQQNFSAAVAACRDALSHNPQSTAAQRRLQRITEPPLRPNLKHAGLLTRDSRVVERKK